nr:protein O-linked-mannose beta-1,2-N-acetylglucosaminyltransferase 1-like [Penaeus vannamei]
MLFDVDVDDVVVDVDDDVAVVDVDSVILDVVVDETATSAKSGSTPASQRFGKRESGINLKDQQYVYTAMATGRLGDWDFWLTWEDLRKNRDVVFPEVSRTFHAGSAGVHVTGFEQESVFNRMIYNLEPEVELDVREVVRDRYDQRLTSDLERALELTPPRDVCAMTWVPRDSSVPVAIYVYAENSNDRHWGYRLFLSCFLTYDENTHEIYKGVIRLRWHGTVVYLVGCPTSPFCRYLKAGQLTKPSRGDLRRASLHRDTWEQTFFEQNPRLYRIKDAPVDQVLNLTNILWSDG